MKGLAAMMMALLFSIAAVAAETEGRAIQFGVQLAPEDATYEELVETWQLIEELGYDHVWLNDHFVPLIGDRNKSNFESWTLLSALAGQAPRIRIGILVTGNTYRQPALLAKMATTLDHISGGRLNFGIGAGWEEFEHHAYGIPFYTAKERAERLDEALQVITKLWRDDHPTMDGKYYQLHEAPFAPKPLQQPHPPIVIGGQGKKWIMPVVARYADEWNVPVGISPDGIRERLSLVGDECARIGRSPCVQTVSVFLPLLNMTSIPLAGPATRLGVRMLAGKQVASSVLAGSVTQIKDQIQEYIDAGATSIIVTTRPGRKHDLMRRFATEVMPAFREEKPSTDDDQG